jgi:hypothetical protein
MSNPFGGPSIGTVIFIFIGINIFAQSCVWIGTIKTIYFLTAIMVTYWGIEYLKFKRGEND